MTSTRPVLIDESVFGVGDVGTAGVQFQRHTWLQLQDQRLPRHLAAKVAVRTCAIPPGRACGWQVVSGVTYWMVLAGDPVVCWADGQSTAQTAGSAFTLDIGRVFRLENLSADRAAILLTLYLTAPDRDHVVRVVPAPAG